MQDKPYYDNSGGGVTITGGEPFMQKEFLNDLVDALKDSDIHVGIETNMSYPWELMRPVLEKIDLVMLDIKLMDNKKHIEYTGVANTNVLANITKLDELGIPFIVRTPLIPGINSSKENIAATARFLSTFDNLAYYELLPYNPLAAAKFEQLGKRYELPGVKRMSSKELSDLKAAVTDAVGNVHLIVREG
jgi:pyruvate formate lyase activating enzyme